MNNEVGGIRNELRQSIEEVRKEIREEGSKWESKMEDMKKVVRQDINDITKTVKEKIENLEWKMKEREKDQQKEVRECTRMEMEGSREGIMKEIEESKQYMGLMFEEIDRYQSGWESKVAEVQKSIEEKINGIQDKLEEKVTGEMKKMEGWCKERGMRKEGDEIRKEVENKKDTESAEMRTQRLAEHNIMKEIPLPNFNNKREENPKRFLEEFNEFIKVRGVSKEWMVYWFKQCLGEETKLWFDAGGRELADYEEVKRKFLERYWGVERQSEVVRKFYTPGGYDYNEKTREQYLLAACRENMYLDHPLSERSLIGAISRQLGSDIAKYAVASNINTVEVFARMLSVWEDVDQEQLS